MDASPATSPGGLPPIPETPGPSQARPFAPPRAVYAPGTSTAGTTTPSSIRTNQPLLPTTNPVSPLMFYNKKDDLSSRWSRFISRLNEIMLGREEKASVYWYASLLSVLAALVVTGSSIFGWPPLPIWEYLRHVTR
ncbi:hypothetical protein VTJ04DRAFT_4608 [Mycothermus thermophilus]|uniref:uncharacterized protein n=1 Tax=Humicola insolens TaxID=85995 RepID=UPI0037438D69